MNLMRSILENHVMVDDHCRYALAEVGEETRHSTMFSRLVNKSGVAPYTYPRPFLKALRLVGFLPIGPSSYAGTLLIEEVLDRLQREGQLSRSDDIHIWFATQPLPDGGVMVSYYDVTAATRVENALRDKAGVHKGSLRALLGQAELRDHEGEIRSMLKR